LRLPPPDDWIGTIRIAGQRLKANSGSGHHGPAGRAIAARQRTFSARASVSHLVWTGRSRDDRALPKGAYLWEIVAADETGRAVRAFSVR